MGGQGSRQGAHEGTTRPTHDVVRAWKDRHYRASLAGSQRSRLPEHPAGIVEVPETRLDAVGAGDIDCVSMQPCSWGLDCTFYCSISVCQDPK